MKLLIILKMSSDNCEEKYSKLSFDHIFLFFNTLHKLYRFYDKREQYSVVFNSHLISVYDNRFIKPGFFFLTTKKQQSLWGNIRTSSDIRVSLNFWANIFFFCFHCTHTIIVLVQYCAI